MKPPPFSYHVAASVEEAVAMLGRLPNARVLAGGQSLVPMLNLRAANPEHLIDLRRIPGLAGIAETADGLAIGAMTTQRAIERSPLVRRLCPLLAEAVDHVGHQQTRNWGTIGGSLCHLDPGAELPVAAAALEATLTVAGPGGTRSLPFTDFPLGYLTPQLDADEILTRIDVPRRPERCGWAFLEFNQRPADFAVVSVATLLTLDGGGRCAAARIALGGIDHVPVRLVEAEAELTGRSPDGGAIAAAADATRALTYEGDAMYPADYRRRLAAVLVRRALALAAERAGLRPFVDGGGT